MNKFCNLRFTLADLRLGWWLGGFTILLLMLVAWVGDASRGYFGVVEQATVAANSSAASEVWLCHRPVDDWRVQLLLPGVAHYSIWIPAQKLHRGMVPDYPLGPLRWGDEVYLDAAADVATLESLGLRCEPVPAAEPVCTARQITRQQDEGVYTFTNHCQTKIVEILESCGGEVPLFLPASATLSTSF
jgi:hypothetical protein